MRSSRPVFGRTDCSRAWDSGRGVALVRLPGERLAEGIVNHLERAAVDVSLARRQHQAYVAALATVGAEYGPVVQNGPTAATRAPRQTARTEVGSKAADQRTNPCAEQWSCASLLHSAEL